MAPENDYWEFVQGLKWLSPNYAHIFERLARNTTTHPKDGQFVLGQAWLHDSIENHSFMAQLQILISNTDHLLDFYYGENDNKSYLINLIILAKEFFEILSLDIYVCNYFFILINLA